MTKADTIAQITRKLAKLSEDELAVIADMVEDRIAQAAATDAPTRALTDREKNLIAQSRADFAAGRTLTLAESRQRTDALIADYVAQNPEHK